MTAVPSTDPGRALSAAFAKVIEAVRERDAEADVEIVGRAFETAIQAHEGQVRRSGEPYLIHPIRVSETIARLGLDTHSVAAGLLHDSVEDSELTVVDLTERFDRELASIVDGVTKLGKVPYLSRQEQQAESFRKMLLAMSQDIRVLLVKLADRLDNMRTLDHMPAEKQARISRETMEIYAPLANRLGIQWIRAELQNLSFRYLEPGTYERIQDKMRGLLEGSEAKIQGAQELLRTAFAGRDPEAEEPGEGDDEDRLEWPLATLGEVALRSSIRTPHQLYLMESEDGYEVDTLADLVVYHVVVPDRASCYAALGVIHAHFKPVPERVRDYIALPRSNRYQALHTMVINRHGRRMEIQIRSATMDAVADRGIVAEWQRDHANGRAEGWRNLEWLGELMDWQGDVVDPHEFIESVKADLFAGEVYVYSPRGDVFTFRRGATPIDFAFAIHTDVGNTCSGARVNGHVVALRYQLRQGDTVEIITSANTRPRQEWLKMCGSSRARAKIKQHLRTEERARLREIGRSLLRQKLASRGERIEEMESQGAIAKLAPDLDLGKELRGADSIYESIGAGLIAVERVLERLAPSPEEAQNSDSNLLRRVFRRVSGARKGGGRGRPGLGAREGIAGSPIVVNRERSESHGAGAPMIQLAACCGPLPGDPLIGYFVPGKGIVAHVEGCPEALEHIDERRVYLAWEEGLEIESAVTIEVRTANTVGLLADLSRAFSYHGVNIKQANCRTIDAGMRALNTFFATVRTLAQLKSLTMTLREIDGVLGVERVFVGSGFSNR